MGDSIGIPTLLCADKYHWTSFGTKHYPFFPDIHLIVEESQGDMQAAAQHATSIVRQLNKA